MTMKDVVEDLSWLGEVVSLESIGDFQVAAYKPNKDDSGNVNKKLMYHGYHEGERFATSYNSVEECLAGTIAKSYDGLNSRADKYFLVGIGFKRY